MKTIYLFDVDGTLTPARQPMETGLANFFRDFVNQNPVYLISGSDYKKLQEQVPQDILDNCQGVFGCSGAQYLEKNVPVYTKNHVFATQLRQVCETFIDLSNYPVRTGNHLEERPGMLNVSVVGRNASDAQRKQYYAWDKVNGERESLIEQINALGLPYEASAGGEISIDLVPKGWNKSVCKREILNRFPGSQLVFFGDRICENGNDLPLARALDIAGQPHKAIPVESYHDTWQHLTEISAGEWSHAA